MKLNVEMPAYTRARARRAAEWLLVVVMAGLVGACPLDVLEEKGPRNPGYQNTGSSHTVLFIHGMFLTPNSWTDWERYFQELGYTTISPPWPGHELSVAEQNAMHPNPVLAELRLDDVVEHYRQIIAHLEEKPIVVGHSMGGLIAQLLLDEQLVAAAIGIASAPPFGVITVEPDFLRTNWPILDPSVPGSEPIKMTLEQFRAAFTNRLTPTEQEEVYRTYVVPESRRVGRAPTTPAAQVHAKTARAPLLLVAGGEDNVITATLNYANFERYKDSKSITDFKQFPDRDHWTIGASGWEAVADYVHRWIVETKAPITRSVRTKVVRESDAERTTTHSFEDKSYSLVSTALQAPKSLVSDELLP